MSEISAFIFDALIFVLTPWLIWRLLQRKIPIAVLPIIVGILLTLFALPVKTLGVPASSGNFVGWIGVLLLTFTAGMETRHPPIESHGPGVMPQNPAEMTRLLGTAAVALALPFAVGTIAAYAWLLDLPGWSPAEGKSPLTAMAVGLCVAVSALPVLVGIVRELPASERSFAQLSLTIAVVDDGALWIGLALLQFAAAAGISSAGWEIQHFAAAILLVGLALAGRELGRRIPEAPVPLIAVVAFAWLVMGSWSTSQLGLHELIGAYFAGVALPPNWVRRLPVEQLGKAALFLLAPLFFGHSGHKVAAEALNPTSLGAAFGLLVLAVTSKVGAVLLFPPRTDLSTRQTLAIGSLLQCKGLMEIVAASILAESGLISPSVFAALVMLAILSTVLTGPMYRLAKGGQMRLVAARSNAK